VAAVLLTRGPLSACLCVLGCVAVPPVPRPRPSDPVPGLAVTRVLTPCDDGLSEWSEWGEPLLVEAFMTPGTGHQLITAGRVGAIYLIPPRPPFMPESLDTD
jgi:hypothetical protein